MRRIFSLLLIFILAFSLVGCARANVDDATTYTIKASLDECTLDINESIRYVNTNTKSLDKIRLVSYVGAFTESGNVAKCADRLAYPFGVNYAKLDIVSVTVNGREAKFTPVDSMYYDIALNKPLKAGKDIDITIKYSETIPKNRLRYGYNSSSINLGNAFIRVTPLYGGEYISYPYSLNGDPFYDEVADFDLTLECDSRYKALTTGRRTQDIDGDRVTYHSVAHNVRDMAVVLSDSLSIFSDTLDDVNIEYMTAKPTNATYISVAKKAITTFNKLFGGYPYDNIAIVENDFLEGGMEYPMLIYVNNHMSEATLEKVIIHELAHQWWYAVVGDNENIDYMIDEGLAELSTYLYYVHNGERVYAEALMKMCRDEYIGYLAGGGPIHRIDIPLSNIDDYSYYIMAYVKAPLMLHKIMCEMGEDKFVAVLSRIYDKYKYRNITIDEFILEFDSYGEKMRQYINGKDIYE